jgi:hypothetical protein
MALINARLLLPLLLVPFTVTVAARPREELLPFLAVPASDTPSYL